MAACASAGDHPWESAILAMTRLTCAASATRGRALGNPNACKIQLSTTIADEFPISAEKKALIFGRALLAFSPMRIVFSPASHFSADSYDRCNKPGYRLPSDSSRSVARVDVVTWTFGDVIARTPQVSIAGHGSALICLFASRYHRR